MTIHAQKPAAEGFARVLFLGLALLFFLGGCAGKPWSGKFGEGAVKTYMTMVKNKMHADAACSSTLDTEAAITWKTAMKTSAFSGYLQLELPSSIKFVTTNPLGQTLFALVSDGTSYSSVNTISHQYTSGSLSSLALRDNIPEEIVGGNWGTWLSGRIAAPGTEEPSDVRKDATGRGIWVRLEPRKTNTGGKEYVLLDPLRMHPLLRVLLDADGDPIAQIKYGQWQQHTRCEQPLAFDITGLPMGAEITVHLSDIITDKVFSKKNFILMPPPGYYITAYP